MKKLFLVALALFTLQSFAQEPPKEMERTSKKERRQNMKDLSPEEQATLSTKKMTLALDLNEKQTTRVLRCPRRSLQPLGERHTRIRASPALAMNGATPFERVCSSFSSRYEYLT